MSVYFHDEISIKIIILFLQLKGISRSSSECYIEVNCELYVKSENISCRSQIGGWITPGACLDAVLERDSPPPPGIEPLDSKPCLLRPYGQEWAQFINLSLGEEVE
jgi:hypothetical protein